MLQYLLFFSVSNYRDIIIFVRMGRQIFILFCVMFFTLSTAGAHAMREVRKPARNYPVLHFSPNHSAHYDHNPQPDKKFNKIYIKTRFKNSEVRFDANFFYFAVAVDDLYVTIKKQEELHFLYTEYHRVISLRGPPSLASVFL